MWDLLGGCGEEILDGSLCPWPLYEVAGLVSCSTARDNFTGCSFELANEAGFRGTGGGGFRGSPEDDDAKDVRLNVLLSCSCAGVAALMFP